MTSCHTETCTATATTTEQPVEHAGDDLRRVGEPVPMCEECAEEARHYPLGCTDEEEDGTMTNPITVHDDSTGTMTALQPGSGGHRRTRHDGEDLDQ